jgi:hypothetical protein
MATYHNHRTDIHQQDVDVDDELGIEHLSMAATSALLLSTPKQKEEEMISYTCMLLASTASQQQQHQQTQTSYYSLQLIYDTEEHLFHFLLNHPLLQKPLPKAPAIARRRRAFSSIAFLKMAC